MTRSHFYQRYFNAFQKHLEEGEKAHLVTGLSMFRVLPLASRIQYRDQDCLGGLGCLSLGTVGDSRQFLGQCS